MGSILNGLALYGGFIPFGATFLVFSDYMRPSIRLANIMGVQVIYVFTHDSVFVGEDGPTHEPVEHIAALRCIPGMVEMRPADGPEVAASWAYALRRQDGPTALILTRQSVPDIARDQPFDGARPLSRGLHGQRDGRQGAGRGDRRHRLRAAVRCGGQGRAGGGWLCGRAWSPCPRAQCSCNRTRVIVVTSSRLARARWSSRRAHRFGWGDVVGADALFITQDTYGHSAPDKVMAEKLGYTNEQVSARILAWLKS